MMRYLNHLLTFAMMVATATAHSQEKTDSIDQLVRDLQTQTAWNQVGQDINGQAAGVQSGWSVSLSDDGTRLAVGAPQNNGNGADAGSVRIFESRTDNNVWTLLGSPITGSAGEGLGHSVSISGDGTTVAIGAVKLFPYTGYVRIYRYGVNQWRLLEQIDGKVERDRFGASVSLNQDGTRVAIGAPYHDGNDRIRGATEIYEQQAGVDTIWSLIGEISGVREGDRSGQSVALSADGTTVAIGAIAGDPGGLSNAGSVRVFKRTSSIGGWNQVGDIIPGTVAGEQSGYAVDISEDGTVVAVGSPLFSGLTTQGGMARVFSYDDTTGWVQLGGNIFPQVTGQATKFGQSVSLSLNGLILAVGEPFDGSIGKAGIYQYNGGLNTWSRDITLSDGAATDRYGYSVALSGQGNRLAVGAYNADQAGTDSGKTRVYEFQTSDWTLSVEDFEANFGTGDAPEFELTYKGEAPPTSTAARTYRMTMLLVSCVLGAASDTSIAPVRPTGTVPAEEEFQLITRLDVNTDTVRTSGFYSDLSLGKGSLAFCVQMEILEGNEVKVERFADINVELDMTQDFLVTDFISRDPTTGKTDIREETQFDYGFFYYFCDENGADIGGGSGQSVPPGGEVSVCLEANDGEPVMVEDVKSVSFENFLAPLLGVDLIDDLGTPLQGTTVKDCANGKCRVAAITVPRLYEYVDSNGNVQDVTAGVSMEGTLVFKFPNRRLQGSTETFETTFSIELDLTPPPDRNSQREASGATAPLGSRQMFATALGWAFATVYCLFQ